MATLAENIARNSAAWDSTRDAIVAKGQEIPAGTPVELYADKIDAIETGGGVWKRPADRPVKPEIEDNTILMLFAVIDGTPNDIAFRIVTSSGTYHVDWGDGTSNDYASDIVAYHLYDFNSTQLPLDTTGRKLAWIKVTGNIGSIIRYYLAHRHSSRPSDITAVRQVLEMYIKCSALQTLSWPQPSQYLPFALLDVFSLHKNDIHGTLSYLLCYCYSLQLIEDLQINDDCKLDNFMYECILFNGVFLDTFKFGIIGDSWMYFCTMYNQPYPQNFSPKTIGYNYMYSCKSYNQPYSNTFLPETIGGDFMPQCDAFCQPFPIGFSPKILASGFLSNAKGYKIPLPGILKIKGGAVLNGNSVFIGIISIDFFEPQQYASNEVYLNNLGGAIGIRLYNMDASYQKITVAYSGNLGREALIALFGDLFDRTSLAAGTITISRTMGASLLTAADKLIATSKNWTIVG